MFHLLIPPPRHDCHANEIEHVTFPAHENIVARDPAPTSAAQKATTSMELKIEQLPHDVTKVNLQGKLDIAGSMAIDLHFNVVVGSQRQVIVDLSEVSFLASMGLRTLIMGAKAVKSKGGRMALLRPTAEVESVLVTSGTDTLIPIAHDLDAALRLVAP